MKKLSLVGAFLLLLAGCGEAPPPEGPAAEATTPDVEVTMPDSTPGAAAEPAGDATPATTTEADAPANP